MFLEHENNQTSGNIILLTPNCQPVFTTSSFFLHSFHREAAQIKLMMSKAVTVCKTGDRHNTCIQHPTTSCIQLEFVEAFRPLFREGLYLLLLQWEITTFEKYIYLRPVCKYNFQVTYMSISILCQFLLILNISEGNNVLFTPLPLLNSQSNYFPFK